MPAGRPKKDVDPAKVEQLAKIGCTVAEIAAVLGCSRDTIHARFSDTLEKGHENRNASIRRAQYDLGVNKKNAQMLIWLGKQYLGQADKSDQNLNHSGDVAVKVLKGVSMDDL